MPHSPALAFAISLPLAACSIGALEGFSGGPGTSLPVDAGSDAEVVLPAADAATADVITDAAPILGVGASCAAIKARVADAKDGRYRIESTNGGLPFEAYCDMTLDDGGWMLVTEAMIAGHDEQATTTVVERDPHGGALLRVFANSAGCGATPSAHLTRLLDVVPWTLLRAHYTYYGNAACWSILGGSYTENPYDPNLIAFAKGTDIVRSEVRMGGASGVAFAGNTFVCDENAPYNFWSLLTGRAPRSLVAVVRRASPFTPAGLNTYVSCNTAGPGITSPTHWEYADIYVR